jgi:hypothetical protein
MRIASPPLLISGVVEYGVEAAEPGHRLFYQFGHVRLAGDIGGDEETSGAPKSKLVCKRPSERVPSSGDHDGSRAFLSAIRNAVARPMPLVAPTTRQTRSASRRPAASVRSGPASSVTEGRVIGSTSHNVAP